MRFILTLVVCLSSFICQARSYDMPSPDAAQIVGKLSVLKSNGIFNIKEIAHKYNLGVVEITEANPNIEYFTPRKNKTLILPTQTILPHVPYNGILINLAELRLYYFDKSSNKVYIFPIGIGKVDRKTPLMTTYISSKIMNPTWTPTAQTRAEYKEKNKFLPPVVPAGPENPLGDRAMRLAANGGVYLIHGTNQKYDIGMRVSAGCIRMNPDDVRWLFDQVKVHTKVRIINTPIKYTQGADGNIFVEVHQPLSKDSSQVGQFKNVKIPKKLQKLIQNNPKAQNKLQLAIQQQTGLPVEITK